MIPNSRGQLLSSAVNSKPVAKMFIICCSCTRWHDLPSKLYEAMVTPRGVQKSDKVAEVRKVSHGDSDRSSSAHPTAAEAAKTKGFWSRRSVGGKEMKEGVTGGVREVNRGRASAGSVQEEARDAKGANGKGKQPEVVETQVFTSVQCPWCEHGMSTGCCAGWTTIVYLHERHH
jgi:hypothetical protein